LWSRLPRSDAERERRARERLTAAIFDTVRALPLALSLPVPADGAASIRALVAADRRSADARIAQSAARRAQRTTLAGSLAALIVIAGAWFERTDLAVLVLFAAFGVRITGALSCVLQGEAGAGTVRAAAARIRALLDAPAQAQGDAELPDNSTLRFSHVDFAYPDGHMRTVLRDIDFIAAAGRVTAIVGPSGSGKTTLTRLAARFWDADSGCVTLGGVDVRSVPVDALMRRIAYVHQDVALLDDTVAANLKLGRPDASDDAMMLAASAAGAHAFISALPDGYRTLVGERGLHLSRGERQRLQIARALLKNAPLVILDEPTSSMDPATELEIQAALAPLFIGKTVLVVAHRLATVAAAHRIIVLDDAGSIEAQGSHAELLGASRTYARLWSDYASATSWPVPQSVRP
jgi:ATP-binding cassette subfamily B protein IrtA